ncbi:MAG: LiaI-LiaF-like domain-containing protein [bacterium]
MTEDYQNKIKARGPNFWTAVSLIFVGLLFLLNNFDLVDIDNFWKFWPLILILIGFAKLKSSDYRDKSSASVLLAIGTFFLLVNLDILDWDILWQLWPVILILIGLSIIFRRKAHHSADGQYSENRVDVVAIFGGNHKMVTSTRFEGGSVTAIFGGAKLDFRNAKLAEGENVVDVFSMFGGAEIRVPRDWHVQIRGVPIFGGFEDARHNVPSEEDPRDRSLVLKGIVLFGGLEIREA